MRIRGVVSALSALAFLLLARDATATEAGRVVLVRTPGEDPWLSQAYVRLRSELVSAGFEVVQRTAPSDAARASLDADADGSPLASILVESVSGGSKAEILIADHATHKIVVRTIDDAHGEPAILAMRVVELMRASLVEPLAQPTPEGVPAPIASPLPPAVERWTAPRRVRGGLAAGAAIVHGGSATGAAVAPTVVGSVVFMQDFRVRLVLVGPAFGGELEAAQGTASLRQEFGLVELGWEPQLTSWLTPRVGGGLGVYHLDARGHARPPYVDGHDGAFAALSSLGGGAAGALGKSARIVLEGRALLAFPRPAVRFAGVEVGSTMRPGLSVALSLEVDL